MLAKIKCKFEFGSIFVAICFKQGHRQPAFTACQWYYVKQLPVLFGSVAFETISAVVMYQFQNVYTHYVKWLIHTFWVYVFVLCVLVVLFLALGINWVMVLDSKGIYVGLVG